MGTWRDRAAAILFRSRPEERIAAAYALAILALLAGSGLPFTVGPLALGYLQFVGAIALLAVPAWLVAQAIGAAKRRFRPADAARDLVDLGRALLPFLVVLVAYTNLKSRLFVLHPTSFDRQLAWLDASVHFGGGDFVGWVLAVHDSPRQLAWLGAVYFYAWLGLAIPFAVAFARRGGEAARHIVLALGLVYVAGGFLYLATPALGPAFWARSRFAALSWGVPFQIQESMLAALRAVVKDPASPAVPFFGIAAMPSLHLATTGLGLFAAWRWARWLLPLLVPLNLAVAWSALVWGWHYAIDFYPGLLLAWAGWWAAGAMLGEPATAARDAPLESTAETTMPARRGSEVPQDLDG